MVDSRREGHLGRFEGVVGGKVDCEEEDTALVWRLGRAHDRRLPVEQVIAHRTRAALRRRVTPEVLQLLRAGSAGNQLAYLLNAFQSHSDVIRQLPAQRSTAEVEQSKEGNRPLLREQSKITGPGNLKMQL